MFVLGVRDGGWVNTCGTWGAQKKGLVKTLMVTFRSEIDKNEVIIFLCKWGCPFNNGLKLALEQSNIKWKKVKHILLAVFDMSILFPEVISWKELEFSIATGSFWSGRASFLVGVYVPWGVCYFNRRIKKILRVERWQSPAWPHKEKPCMLQNLMRNFALSWEPSAYSPHVLIQAHPLKFEEPPPKFATSTGNPGTPC